MSHTATERDLIRQAFALTLRRLRRRIGIAQEKLALEAGVDRGYMSGLECAKHTPTLATVLRFLPYLQVTFPEFAAEFERYLTKLQEKPAQSGLVNAQSGLVKRR
jgi:transcriptional regulator with XRE-family HTH domain